MDRGGAKPRGAKRRAGNAIFVQVTILSYYERFILTRHFGPRSGFVLGSLRSSQEKAALLSGVEKHGRDWEKIKASSGDRLAKRSKIALQQHLRDHHPDKYKELREPKRTDLWTEEEDAALLEGAEKYGHDWDKIKAESGGRLGKRSARAIEDHLRRLK